MKKIEIFNKDIFEEVRESNDFIISPNKLEKINLKREIIFDFQNSFIQSKIEYRCLALNSVNLDLTIKLLSQKMDIEEVIVYLEVHVLNIGLGNSIKIKPFLEIPHENIKFEHKVTIGAPDSKWVNYLRSKGLSEASAKELIINSFI